MSNNDRHLLVTGGAGFIGANFIHFIRRQRPTWRITNLDALTYSGNVQNLAELESDEYYNFVKGDVCDAALVRRLADSADAVVHFAAESHVDRSIADSRPFITTNIMGVQTMLDACRGARGGAGIRLLYVSTDEVYGSLPLERPELKFTEDTPLAPNSPYAASKAAGDLLVRADHHTFGADVITTRCSNNFGPYQYPEKVIPLFVTNLLDNSQVPLYGDGGNVRDWLHVEDHCQALLAVLEDGRAGGVYNIGGDNERSNLELTKTILAIMGKGEEMIQPVQDRLGHDRRYAIDAGKIRRELGWRPTRSAWPAALEETIGWYIDHQQWWRPLQAGQTKTRPAVAQPRHV